MNFFAKLNEIESNGTPVVLCIVTNTHGSTPRHAGSKMIVYPNGDIFGTVGGGKLEALCIEEALKLLHNGLTNTLNYRLVNPEMGDPGVCGGELEVYLEVIGKKSKVVILGAGHVGKQLSYLAKWIGFDVILIDDREELISEQNIPDVSQRYRSFSDFLAEYGEPSLNDIYVVMTTRNLEIDVKNIPEILKLNPRYLGVIGSKKRWVTTTELLLKAGVSDSEIEKIFSPIGLDLGSESPEEIALSIVAEILKQKNKTSGDSLRYFRRKKVDVE